MKFLKRECKEDEILEKSTDFAKIGLRTLVFAYRKLTRAEFAEFKEEYEKENNQNAKFLIECEMDFIGKTSRVANTSEFGIIEGVSAVEDLLQEGVASTIQNIKQAGINFWILTGDKLETAEFICKSVKLKEEHNEFVKLVGIEDPKEMLKKIDYYENHDKKICEVKKRCGYYFLEITKFIEFLLIFDFSTKLTNRKFSYWISNLWKRSSKCRVRKSCSSRTMSD